MLTRPGELYLPLEDAQSIRFNGELKDFSVYFVVAFFFSPRNKVRFPLGHRIDVPDGLPIHRKRVSSRRRGSAGSAGSASSASSAGSAGCAGSAIWARR